MRQLRIDQMHLEKSIFRREYGRLECRWRVRHDRYWAFGAVMYEVVTGQHCKFDPMQDWKKPGDPFSWPRRDSLPSIHDLWLSHIIEACLVQGSFASAGQLASALEDQDAG